MYYKSYGATLHELEARTSKGSFPLFVYFVLRSSTQSQFFVHCRPRGGKCWTVFTPYADSLSYELDLTIQLPKKFASFSPLLADVVVHFHSLQWSCVPFDFHTSSANQSFSLRFLFGFREYYHLPAYKSVRDIFP